MQQRRKRSKKWLGGVVFAVLVIVIGVVGCLVWSGRFGDDEAVNGNETTVVKNTETEVGVGENSTEEVNDRAIKKGDIDEVVQYEGENPNAADELTGVVTYKEIVNGELMIRVNIDQYLDSGSCELVLVNGGATIYNSVAEIVGSASTASCAGFDVPVKELPGGETQIIVYLSANGKIGEIKGETNI